MSTWETRCAENNANLALGLLIFGTILVMISNVPLIFGVFFYPIWCMVYLLPQRGEYMEHEYFATVGGTSADQGAIVELV